MTTPTKPNCEVCGAEDHTENYCPERPPLKFSTKPMFTAEDFLVPAYEQSATLATDIANAKIQPLVDENARLNKTMQLQIEELVAGANTRTEFRTQINDLKNCIHVTNEVVAKQAAENTKLRAALEELLKAWTAYFNPDVGPPGDENKQLLFNQWTDTVAKTYEAIK